jgi:hypothetical protein
MKTTIEISDPLLLRAKQVASSENTTLRALVEDGLRKVLEDNATRTKPFRLKQVTFGGQGLQPQARGAGWEKIRELAYEGHGG